MKTRIHNNRRISPLNIANLATVVTIFTAAIIFASTTSIPVASTTGNTTSTTTSTISPSGLELSTQPIWDELAITTGEH